MNSYELHHGDCLDVMRTMPDNSVHSIVCDPPYGLSSQPDIAEVMRHWLAGDDYKHTGGGFMGKTWDSFVPGPVYWRECFRVLKPGGHLLAFAGSRTQDLMGIAIRFAGFELRDSLLYLFGSGFPKGHDVAWDLHKMACNSCGVMVEHDHESFIPEEKGCKEVREHRMRFVRASYLQTPVYACAECGQVLQPFLSEQESQKLRASWSKSKALWPKQPSVEGRCDMETAKGELQRCEVCQMSHGVLADGSEGWLHNGAPIGNGSIPWQVANEDGSRPSYRPQSFKQLHNQPNAFQIERRAQESRGFNAALKPAYEPCLMARKPLDGTLAHNTLKYGCGGINVDASRVGTNGEQLQSSTTTVPKYGKHEDGRGSNCLLPSKTISKPSEQNPSGRWPANVITDGSEAVVGLFPVTTSGTGAIRKTALGQFGLGGDGKANVEYGDSGSAARFFYTAKCSKSDRNEGLDGFEAKKGQVGNKWTDQDYRRGDTEPTVERKNHHPTLKPTALMLHLVKLVTPPNGTVLDPFAGSGSCGKAAMLMEAGCHYIGIEREAEYVEIAKARLKHAQENADELRAKYDPNWKPIDAQRDMFQEGLI